MENTLFFATLFALFLNFSMGAMSYSGINRTFQNMYRGLIEASIAFVDEKGEPIEAYFKKDVLEKYATNYLKENLARYVTHYKASIYYFDKENQVVCTSSYCRSVKISLDCEINYFFHYTKARNFYINQSYE